MKFQNLAASCLLSGFCLALAGCGDAKEASDKTTSKYAAGDRPTKTNSKDAPRSRSSAAKTMRSEAPLGRTHHQPVSAGPKAKANPTFPAKKPREKPLEKEFNTESYDYIVENRFVAAATSPLSTFSIDVDTASYANVRRFLQHGQMPPPGAVRVEELVNYFSYDYPAPKTEVPFSINVEVAGCPWQRDHKLVRIGLKGREIDFESRPASNLVFLLDVSGSMRSANKLPLAKAGMRLLVEQLSENDRVAIVVYASASGLYLPSTGGDQKETILSALDRLQAKGSTNGGEGIRLAYDTAVANFVEGGINRVILCTDGDFNVGTSNQSELVRLIEKKARSGVFLTVLGFGTGNLKDSTMEKLADKGNGNYAYIDSISEARKVLVEELSGTLITIAKDVKIQVDFNSAKVAAYRLLGYENRMLRAEDFKDDAKDAGEIGAGHTVTALYQVVPVGAPNPYADVDPSKYQKKAPSAAAVNSKELLTVRIRYKDPDGQQSKSLEMALMDVDKTFDSASVDFRFASMVAAFGMLLRDSKYKGDADFDSVLEIAASSRGTDPFGYRRGFIELVRTARDLKR